MRRANGEVTAGAPSAWHRPRDATQPGSHRIRRRVFNHSLPKSSTHEIGPRPRHDTLPRGLRSGDIHDCSGNGPGGAIVTPRGSPDPQRESICAAGRDRATVGEGRVIRRTLAWAQRQLHVRRDPVGFARSLGVRVGDRAWLVDTSAATWGSEPFLITLGDDVTVASGVRFLNHDGTVLLFRREHPDMDLIAPITVGDNVFIGLGVTIMPGVTIGSDCVVGAGAIVTRDLPAGSIAVGQPARVVSTIDAWWKKNQGRLINIRGLPKAERRRTLLEHFGLADDALARTRR